MRTLIASLILAAASPAFGQFQTYQGRLDDAGSPASGIYDFRVEHFAVPSGGTSVGLTNEFVDVPVQNGLFSLIYDAAPGTFDGSQRWLQISVRPGASTGAFTPLPRQRVTATPYAIRSLNERWTPTFDNRLLLDAGINNVLINATTPPISDAALTARGTGSFAGMYVDVSDATANSYFGWATGGVSRAEARYRGSDNSFVLITGSGTRVSITSDGRVGVGTTPTTALQRLQVGGATLATDYDYAAPQIRTLTLHPSAFVANGGTAAANIRYLNDRVYFAAAGTFTVIAPVSLPEGATITAVDAIIVDNSAGDFTISLSRNQFSLIGGTTIATLTSTGATGGIQTLSTSVITTPVVTNTTASYCLFATSTNWDVNLNYLKGVRITYTVTSPD